VGYDGFKHRYWTKIHVCVDRDSMPLSIIVGPGNEHDSRRLTAEIAKAYKTRVVGYARARHVTRMSTSST
jgi:hypothetical protein